MKIEDRWIDCTIYFVGFYVENKNPARNQIQVPRFIKKTLVFDSSDNDNYNENDRVEKHILANFNNVQKIEYIEIYADDVLRPISCKEK